MDKCPRCGAEMKIEQDAYVRGGDYAYRGADGIICWKTKTIESLERGIWYRQDKEKSSWVRKACRGVKDAEKKGVKLEIIEM